MLCKRRITLPLQIVVISWLFSIQLVAEDKKEPLSTNWSFFRGNPAMTGVSNVDLGTELELTWSFQAPGERIGCTASAVINEGKVYIGDDDGVFHCLSLEDGSELWKFETGDIIEGTACFAGDLVVFGAGDGFVYALDKDTGAEKWKFETNGEILGSMNLFVDAESKAESIVFGSYDNFCYSLAAATGEKQWEFETGNYINGAVAIGDEHIMFGGCDGFIYRLNGSTGESVGDIEMGSHIASTIAVDLGVAYTGHYGNRVSAFHLDEGTELWEYGEREFPFFSSPAVLPERIVVGGRDKRVHCINRVTGEGIWEFRARDQVDSSPVICGNTIFIGCDDGVLYALALDDGEELWSYELGEAIKSSPAVVDGYLVISTDDGGVHAFRPKSVK